MSMLTRCPACETCYRVVPDQLRVSQGWVRCGQCKEIFDAAAHQVQAAVTPSPPPTTPAAVVSPPSEPMGAQGQDPVDVQGPVPWPRVTDTDALAQIKVSPEPHADLPDHQHALLADTAPAIMRLDDEPIVLPAPALGPELHFNDVAIAPAGGPGLRQGTDDRREPEWPMHMASDGPSFLKSRAAPAPEVSGVATWLWALLALGLVMLLLAQWAYRERHHLALQFPTYQPTLRAVCEVLHCQIEPVRALDALVIEGASLTAVGKDAYRLSLVLQNKVQHVVAMPDLEVTLTDALDQVLVRKVLHLVELGIDAKSLAAGQALQVDTGLELTGSPPVAGVSGYRVLAFYP